MNADDLDEDSRRSDVGLLRSFVAGDADERAEAFLAIYERHCGAVRAEMERAGLDTREAEQRVGMVFDRTLAALSRGGALNGKVTLSEHLLDAARHAAKNSE